MTGALQQFVAIGKKLAADRELRWDAPHDEIGNIDREYRWNLSRIVGSPTQVWFSSIGWHDKILEVLISIDPNAIEAHAHSKFLDAAWRDFCQAALIDLVFIKQQAPHGAYRLLRNIKILALSAGGAGPADITGDHVRRAYDIALRMGDGEAARVFPGFVRNVIDGQHLAHRPHLALSCIPYPDIDALERQYRVDAANARSNSKGYRKQTPVLDLLHERKDAMKLPDHEAFWELCRIVFTEEPRSLHDLQLFACGRLHIITGLRAAEVALLPCEWEQWREWTDIHGRPAGLKGGISRSLAIRHFAGKQGSKSKGDRVRQLVPRIQDVPKMFEDIVLHTLHEVENATAPLRENYRRQILSKRLFPDLAPDSLIPLWELYVRLFGNMQVATVEIPSDLTDRYRRGTFYDNSNDKNFRFEPSALEAIRNHQLNSIRLVTNDGDHYPIATSPISYLARQYWADRRSKVSTDLFRDQNGLPYKPTRGDGWGRVHFRVGEVEAELRRKGLADHLSEPALAVRGESAVAEHQFLFLTTSDKGGVRTENSTLDVEKYVNVRRFKTDTVIRALGSQVRKQHLTLFARYGRTPEDRELTLNPHAMRHLQNTELFRKGLADSIITKRFDRVSVQQSHEYDHRSLAEHLENIDIPSQIEDRLGPKASTTARLIASGRVSGPLVDRFKVIRREEGDEAAFDFLVAEADGLHATPYGFCLNSFTVDPCPKHLECFNGCLHLARTDLPSEQQSLTELRDRTATVLAKVQASPPGSLGRCNQIDHAQKQLVNIEKALATPAGAHPFPDGADLSVPIIATAGSSLIDRPAPAFRNPLSGLDMTDA